MKRKSVYLIATYFAKPKMKNMTHVKGYMDLPSNVTWDEQIEITSRLSDKALVNSRIVLNIVEQKVVRNSFQNHRSFADLFEYFYKGSPEQITQGLNAHGIQFGKPEDNEKTTVDVPSETNQESSGPVITTTAHAPGPSEDVAVS